MPSVTSGAVANVLANINAIEQKPNTTHTLWLNGSATPDTSTTMNVAFSFPFYLKNVNYSINITQIFIENIGLRNSPVIGNLLKYEGGFTVFISGFSNLILYNAYNVRFACVEITFA